ncbi:uncharacterized protein LOC119101231 [Pollicipes pollicipes]|uniref:uncharacterized protein LOC119101231 n=1 Tax=Pollicipes pollicipes TaxID=41117 RepID=UPI0018859E9F|nr:uncharacterized protein LOC119101231 [Pollicipes pollicipes]XP_037080424.1 uncharacterized protein LOC119101231 [Pollicipes pollicipes]
MSVVEGELNNSEGASEQNMVTSEENMVTTEENMIASEQNMVASEENLLTSEQILVTYEEAVEEKEAPRSVKQGSTEEKKKQYPQRYRPLWEQLDFCKGWLKPYPKNRLMAYCKACDRRLHARKNDLKKHSQCERHKMNMGYLQQGTPVRRASNKGSRSSFHPSLLEHKETAGWLSGVPGEPHRAWCRQCACRLTPQLKALRLHGESRKHRSNSERRPTSPPSAEADERGERSMDETDGRVDEPVSMGLATPSVGDRSASPLLESDFSGRVTYSIGLGNRKVGFLGAGQIAQAIAQGMLEQGLLLPHDVMVSAPSNRNLAQWRRWKCHTTHSNDEILEHADVVFLAVKAPLLVGMVEALTPVSDDKARLIISVIPGVTRARVAELLASRVVPTEQSIPNPEEPAPSLHVVRCSPNKMMSISAGFCAYCMGDDVPHALYLVVETMFSALGTCVQVEESLMDAYSTMVGSGAAFTCAYIEAMVQGGVNLNIAWDDALKVAAAVVSGTSKLLMRTSIDPSALRKAISTPGGSTIAGLAALQRGGLDEAVVRAMDVACRKTTDVGSHV